MTARKSASAERVLQDRVVWVIGATGAIGSVVAAVLAAHGATVVASGRRASVLDAVVALIAAAGGRARARPLNTGNGADIERAVGEIVQEFGAVDGLVNSTALSIFGDFLELTDEQWLQVLDAKLLGYIRSMRAVLPQMIKQGRGNIVNVSGRGGRQPTPAHLPGGCANAAVNLLTKGISDTYLKHGIRANVVSPGPIVSDRFEKIRASNARLTAGAAPRLGADRMGEPEDVANAILWLLSEQSRHITGAVIPVDGGGTATV